MPNEKEKSPKIHPGDIALLEKMRQFQKMGHEVVFIIDVTGSIGALMSSIFHRGGTNFFSYGINQGLLRLTPETGCRSVRDIPAFSLRPEAWASSM
jgi:hypothetical protein